MTWALDDIAWEKFDPRQVTPQLLALAKAASLVEANSRDYARYLCEVFSDDPEFQQAARDWAEEEVQHGMALKRWAELADPAFDYKKSFDAFVTGYTLPKNVQTSVRGSRSGELIARCVVEIGTSSYYTALKQQAGEPVFQEICGKIAADEFRHYKLFYTYLRRYAVEEKLSLFARLRVAIGRIAESEDDELAYAFYAAHYAGTEIAYDHKVFKNHYLALAYPIYRRENVEKMIVMVWKAIGLKPMDRVTRLVSAVAWHFMSWRAKAYAPFAV